MTRPHNHVNAAVTTNRTVTTRRFQHAQSGHRHTPHGAPPLHTSATHPTVSTTQPVRAATRHHLVRTALISLTTQITNATDVGDHASGNAKILVSGQLSPGSRTPEFLVRGQVVSVPTF